MNPLRKEAGFLGKNLSNKLFNFHPNENKKMKRASLPVSAKFGISLLNIKETPNLSPEAIKEFLTAQTKSYFILIKNRQINFCLSSSRQPS